uniref:Uncharacterized protein n=1 Tax=Candidatus Kentrum sp. UNK TaxID=2126344 RepID=A0A451A0I8_9GAMM|nr:MAG: hypothetical protein BECKUNK1418G_GA0071005_100750 [Candidatus Kentron sp. UNK]VFK68683.1 MAG: hypothetical protein BECKUNK1418H_GA0071006_10052 [Candidatus Kentron sp. UNK]
MELIVKHQDIATLIFSGVVALSTVVYAVLTALLVVETKQMRRAQTEPKLVAYVEPREEFINFAHLYIQNVGPGPAFNVAFKLSGNKDDEGAQLLIEDFSKSRFLDTGVEYIGPTQRMSSRDTAFTQEFQKKIKAILYVEISYRSSTGRKYFDKYSIDMSQFEGAGGLGTPHLYSIAQSLKKLQEDFHRVSTGSNKLKVETFTHEDRERARAEWEEWRNERLQSTRDSEEST